MISFEAKYWFIILPAIIIIALAVAFLLYFRNKENEEMTKIQLRILTCLRFMSFFLIAFLLLSPFIKNFKKFTQQPVIITAWDNSASIVSTGDSAKISSTINTLKETVSNQIKDNYSEVSYSFGQETQYLKELTFKDKKSDYGNLITTVINNHYNENIGALVIAGDGVYNQGRSPVNMLEDITFPVYTIGLGDTSEIADAFIQKIRVNRNSFAGNSFPVEIDTRFIKLKNRRLKLTIEKEGKIVAEKIISPPSNDFFQSDKFILQAGSPGLNHYNAKIEILRNERNKKNNIASFILDVLENKQKILILSDGPHPDNGALKNTLEQLQSFEVSLFTEEPYPSNLSDFNLVILNQLPKSGKSLSTLLSGGKNQRIPFLFIIGEKTFIPQLNIATDIINIEPLAGSPEEAQAIVNKSFAIFTLSENLSELLGNMPPLQVPFANYKLKPELSVMLYQKLNNIETKKPLIATGIVNGKKAGFIFGEGIWKWRLYDYYYNQSHKEFNELVTKLIQFLSLRENEDNFMINFKSVYDEIEDVKMTAEVYNEAFEKITNEEVIILIKNEQGDELNFTFDVSEEEYLLNAGKLPMGNYNFNAKVTIDRKTYTEKGNFTVKAVNMENIITRANHSMLYQLAGKSGGEFLLPEQTGELNKKLNNNIRLKPVIILQDIVYDIINLKWIVFVLIMLLGMEWFLRKYWGIY